MRAASDCEIPGAEYRDGYREGVWMGLLLGALSGACVILLLIEAVR